jgi:hypothetical protein
MVEIEFTSDSGEDNFIVEFEDEQYASILAAALEEWDQAGLSTEDMTAEEATSAVLSRWFDRVLRDAVNKVLGDQEVDPDSE